MESIQSYDQIYRRTITEPAGSADPHYIRLERVRPRKILVLTHVTVENKTLAYTKCRLGIDNGGLRHYIDEISSPAADELCVSRSDIVLGEGDVFFAELTGIAAGQILIMTCIGWKKEL